MRSAAFMMIGSLVLAAVPTAAMAAPAIPNLPAPQAANLVQVSGGCGPFFHRNPWGYCAANHYGYGWYGGYYGPRFGWGYHPYWHHHHWHF